MIALPGERLVDRASVVHDADRAVPGELVAALRRHAASVKEEKDR